jgi:hypothetical protein
MKAQSKLSILSNATSADLVLEPYPHLVLENALDADVFGELEATFPSDEIVVDGRPLRDTWYDYPACKVVKDDRLPRLWRDFFRYHTSAAFFADLVRVAGPTIRSLNPGLERRVGRPIEKFAVGMRPGGRGDPLAPDADVSMECQFYVNYTRAPRVVRGPHIDRPSELFAALLYFRQKGDSSQGGDLQICEAIRDIYPTTDSVKIDVLPAEVSAESVRVVKTAAYEPNTLVLFLNSPRALHSISPRTSTPVTRRHINFCCDTNFDLFTFEYPARLKLKRRLQGMPVAWRLAEWI